MSCTGIVESCQAIDSEADGRQGWFKLGKIVASLDTGIHTPGQYALCIDFVSESQDIKNSVELSPMTAKNLVTVIQVALSKGVNIGILDER